MHKNQFLSNYIIKQFDVNKFKKMIKIFLSIVDNFQHTIDKDEFYIKYTANYEIKVGGSQKPTSSKVESFVIKKYDTEEKKEQLLLKYKNAFNCLNEMERKIFVATFLENKTNLDLCDELVTYDQKINYIRKSAIVRFCLKLGFERFVDYF